MEAVIASVGEHQSTSNATKFRVLEEATNHEN